MADKKVLLDVQINLTDAVKQMADYQTKVREIDKASADLKKRIKEEGDQSGVLTQQLVVLNEQRKVYNSELSNLSRGIQQQITAEQTYEGTLKGLCAQLAKAKDELRSMAMTDPKYKDKEAEVAALNDRIKGAEGEYGVFTRNVGNYENAIKNALSTMIPFGRQIESVTSLLGGGNDKAGMAGAASGAADAATQAGAATAKAGSGIITTIKGLGKALLGLLANPIFAVLAGLAVVIMGISKAIKSSEEQTARWNAIMAPLNRAVQFLLSLLQKASAFILTLIEGAGKLFQWIAKQAERLPVVGDAIAKVNEANREAIRLEKEKLAITEQERKNQVQNAQDELEVAKLRKVSNDKENTTIAERLLALDKANKLEEAMSKRNVDIAKRKLSALQTEAQWAENNAEMNQKIADAEAAVYKAELEYYQGTIRLQGQMNMALKEAAAEREQNARKHLDIIQKLELSALRVSKVYQYDSTKTAEQNNEAKWQSEMEFAQKEFALAQKQKADNIALDLKYGKITKKQQKALLQELSAEANEFAAAQAEAVAEHARDAIAAVVALAGGKDIDGQIADIKTKYAEARATIRNDSTKSADEIAFYERMLANKEAEEIKAIRTNAQDTASKNIEQRIKEQYSTDSRLYSDNAIKRTEYEIEVQKRIIDERKKAGLNVLADEAKLAQLEAQLNSENIAKELQLAWNNADEQFRIRKEFIEKELALEGLAAEQRAKLEQELAEITAGYNQQKIAQVEEYANQVMDIASSVSEVFANLADAQLNKAEASNESQKASLESRLNSGLISQKQYDKQVAALDADLDAKKAKLAREAAIREKAIGAAQIAINTAAAIMKIWAEFPKVDFGASTLIMTGVAAAVGAAQLAAVLSTPIPTAGAGGLIEGASHAQGGVLVNTEGGERIVSASPSRAFPELLNLISYIGKHANIPNTGYASRSVSSVGGATFYSNSSDIDYDLLADKVGAKVSSAIKDVKIYLSLDELRTAEKEYAKIEESAKM